MKITFTALCLLLLTVWESFSQEFERKKLDSYFDALEKHNRFMGSVAVSQNGELIYTRSLGFADIASSLRADVNS